MRTFRATIVKELLELRRDRAGLMVLLAMPMALVLIVSLVQDNVMQATGDTAIRVLFVDEDHGRLASSLAERLRAERGLELVESAADAPLTRAAAQAAVRRGAYQFLLVAAPGTTDAFVAGVEDQIVAAFGAAPDETPGPGAALPAPAPAVKGLTLYVDPAVQASLRTAVAGALHHVLIGLELREKSETLAKVLPQRIRAAVADMLPPADGRRAAGSPDPLAAVTPPDIRFSLSPEPLLGLTEAAAVDGPAPMRPTAAQQNVPAWALFGMFFIVVPLSGTIIRERDSGTFRRLMAMPISPAGLLTGKIAAYVIVCVAQCALMLAVGWAILPLLGTSGLVVPLAQWPGVALTAVVAAAAATGFGLLVGTIARSQEQASMFGAVAVVIAAALGGIMVPQYVMPRSMHAISAWSPLAWGLNAFQDIFVRGGSALTAAGWLLRLAGFAALTIGAAVLVLRRRQAGE